MVPEEKLLEVEIEPGMRDGQIYPFVAEGKIQCVETHYVSLLHLKENKFFVRKIMFLHDGFLTRKRKLFDCFTLGRRGLHLFNKKVGQQFGGGEGRERSTLIFKIS